MSARLQVGKWTTLPEAIIGNALAVAGRGEVYSVGGYNGKHSLSAIYRLADKVSTYAKLPTLMHDEAAGWIGSDLYAIGGGQSSSYDTIYRMTADRNIKLERRFFMPISDVSAVPYAVQGNPGLLLIGGYDGKTFNRSAELLTRHQDKLRWDPAFTMPVGLRYSAVASDGQNVYMAGGKTPTGLSGSIYVWNGKERKPQVLAELPSAREKAAAFVWENQLWIIGGIDVKGQVLDQIVRVNTKTGETKLAAPFPTPIADMGYTQDGNTGYLAGGQVSKQGYSAAVYKLTVRP